MPRPSFLVVDDHPLFLEALQAALQKGFAGAVIEVAADLDQGLAAIGRSRFNLVLLDLRLPGVEDFEGLARIRKSAPESAIAIISAAASADIIRRARALGANGFIHKGSGRAEILAAAGALLEGRESFPELPAQTGKDADALARLAELTPHQRKVLARVCEAKLNKQIAFELGVTETTVKAHITSIFKKLGVHSRTQAVLLMQRVDPDFAAPKGLGHDR